MKRLLGLLLLLPFLAGPACAADVHVMISAGYFKVYSELGPAFERTSGHRLVTTRGPSMGDSPESIPTRLTRGEPVQAGIYPLGSIRMAQRLGSWHGSHEQRIR